MRISRLAFASWAPLLCALGLSLASSAHAADMAGAPVIPDEAMIPQEVGTGWYLRGDVGYAFHGTPDYGYESSAFSNVGLEDKHLFSLGFGYQFTDMFRVDATVDFLGKSKLTASATCAIWSTADCTGNPTYSTAERGSVSAIAVLLNGYADIGTWEGLTPYVGVGVGLARTEFGVHDSYTDGSVAPDRSFASRTGYSLAASAAAGASYTLGDGLVMDIGYRFLWIDGGKSGSEAAGQESGKIKYNNLTSHQVRAGLRYYLN